MHCSSLCKVERRTYCPFQAQILPSKSCRSNETHIAWREDTTVMTQQSPRRRVKASQQQPNDDDSDCCCTWQTHAQASNQAYHYLRQHVWPFDEPFLETMGFSRDDKDDSSLPDGLNNGLIGPTIQYALKAKIMFEYTDALPKPIWQEYVLNPFHLNEARSNWRPLLWDKLSDELIDSKQQRHNISSVVHWVNQHAWRILAPHPNTTIVFEAGSTPLIFDTMSVLVFGKASCTGLAIVLANALRALGVPARIAGTPAWYGNATKGNHNWVEVWNQGQWYFMEPTVPTAVDGILDDVDDLERNPCRRWFCQAARYAPGPNQTKVYAARLDSSKTTEFFRLAWEWETPDVPADDRTAYYQEICGACP